LQSRKTLLDLPGYQNTLCPVEAPLTEVAPGIQLPPF